ncbi:MAG: sulfotransferase domain-containing protein [Candidatus Electrothrix sp. GW3-4]|uniref:sulfotransferase domain-containing protein n=1 Tax=Candidatus Electrothrix sp. GW3-4 TaxID=3126740 RepID=UPI0030CFB9BB
MSGLPRSGTSMMMNILEAGGIPAITDHQRAADIDNPKGYYEYEQVKELPNGETKWLNNANGRAVKIISSLLQHLPEPYQYRIIIMERKIEEVLISQKKMLERRNEISDNVSDEELTTLFHDHLHQTEDWLQKHHHHVSCLRVSYNTVLKNPEVISRQINRFLGGGLDVRAMTSVIDPALYRNKKT